MSYLDLLPSEIQNLLDVFANHGCKVVLFPLYTVALREDTRWVEIIRHKISEDTMCWVADAHLHAGARYICTLTSTITCLKSTPIIDGTVSPSKLAKIFA